MFSKKETQPTNKDDRVSCRSRRKEGSGGEGHEDGAGEVQGPVGRAPKRIVSCQWDRRFRGLRYTYSVDIWILGLVC